jgi:hypothetical protein
MVFQDESTMIVESTNSPKISCSETKSSSSVPQCFHPTCSHCDVNFLKTIKSEIKQLTNDTELFKYSSIDNPPISSYTPFETQRSHFYTIIDEWKSDRIEHISFIYQKKKNQIDLICSQTSHEYEIFKIEQKTFLNDHLLFNNNIHRTLIPNEIEELNQKLSLTRHLLDYFIQPKLDTQNSFSEDDDDTCLNYEEIFKEKAINEYS